MPCWAAPLDLCDEKLSREHLVTESFWRGDSVTVVGFPWYKTEPKVIGTAALVSKILCRKHNSALSPVDVAGAHAFHSLEAAEALTERRRHIPAQEWMRVCYSIDGPLIERWFLKTTINLLAVTNTEIQWALTNGEKSVPLQLVRAAYGLKTLHKPLGLYLCARVGDQFQAVDGLGFMPIFEAHDRFAAAFYEFRGFRFVLNLIESSLPTTLPEMPGRAAPWSGNVSYYHLNRINSNVGRARSHFVDFEWPGSTFDHFAA